MPSVPSPIPEALRIMVETAYAAALCYGFISDVRSLKIPNAVCLGVLALFFLNYWLLTPQDGIAQHLIAGGAAFAVTFAIYAAGIMGAGDVKLISALMLWAGSRDGLAFLIVMTFIGGLMAGLLLILQKAMALWPAASRYIKPKRLKTWARLGIFPYGIAICAAGLILMPSFFARPH